MAKINKVELKGVKPTLGREGYGFTANVYHNNKNVGSVADYGDGAICLNISLQKGKEEELKEIAKAYYKKYPTYGVGTHSDDFILTCFFQELHELKEHETTFKKNVKKGYKKLLVLSQAKRGEDPTKDTSYIYNDVIIGCNFEGDTPSKALVEKLEKDYPNTKEIIWKFTKLEDFDIE